jgi:hypothetical protein
LQKIKISFHQQRKFMNFNFSASNPHPGLWYFQIRRI